MSATTTAPPKAETEFRKRLQGLVRRAEQGDETALPELRAALDANPWVWERFGDLARQSEAAWLRLIAGPNLMLRESVQRKAGQLRTELAGPRAVAAGEAARRARGRLLVAVHHPVYSLGGHGATRRVAQALDHAVRHSGRVPDAVLSGQDHNYQRFTRKFESREVPYLVVGAGGMAGYDLSRVHKHRDPGEGVKLEHSNHQRPGFLRVTVTPGRLVGEHFTVPGPGRENDGEQRDDHFQLDLKHHRLV
jgi:hypothetical protein